MIYRYDTEIRGFFCINCEYKGLNLHLFIKIMLIDSHCHLDDTAFDEDRFEVLERARVNGVSAVIVPAISRQRFQNQATICENHLELHAAYGLHPLYLDEHSADDINELDRWMDSHPTVAIGECGLDKYAEKTAGLASFTRQRELFEAQLALAKKRNLPVIVHANGAIEDTIRVLKSSQLNQGVVHSYNGSAEQARQLIDDGYHLGIGSAVTRPDARRLHTMVKALPLDSMLLETDAPFQAAATHRGQRNEPGFITEVAEMVARLQGLDVDKVEKTTTANSTKLFSLSGLDNL